MGQPRGGGGGAPVVDRVVHLVADELDSALGGEIVERGKLFVAESRPGGIVRRVDEQDSRASVGELLDLVEVNAELIFAALMVMADFQPKAPRDFIEAREAQRRHENIGAGFGGKSEEKEEGFGRPGCDLDVFRLHAFHFGYGLAQGFGALNAHVNQLGVKQVLERVVGIQFEEFPECPDRART